MSAVLNKPLVTGATSIPAGNGLPVVVSVSDSPGLAAASVPAELVIISEENYTYLQQEIYRQSGIVLDDDKHYLLESRLMPVARAAKLANLDELCTRLRNGIDTALAQ